MCNMNAYPRCTNMPTKSPIFATKIAINSYVPIQCTSYNMSKLGTAGIPTKWQFVHATVAK